MAGSTLAADIAYYLATHRIESIAIAKLPLADQARAISDIESRMKQENSELGREVGQ